MCPTSLVRTWSQGRQAGGVYAGRPCSKLPRGSQHVLQARPAKGPSWVCAPTSSSWRCRARRCPAAEGLLSQSHSHSLALPAHLGPDAVGADEHVALKHLPVLADRLHLLLACGHGVAGARRRGSRAAPQLACLLAPCAPVRAWLCPLQVSHSPPQHSTAHHSTAQHSAHPWPGRRPPCSPPRAHCSQSRPRRQCASRCLPGSTAAWWRRQQQQERVGTQRPACPAQLQRRQSAQRSWNDVLCSTMCSPERECLAALQPPRRVPPHLQRVPADDARHGKPVVRRGVVGVKLDVPAGRQRTCDTSGWKGTSLQRGPSFQRAACQGRQPPRAHHSPVMPSHSPLMRSPVMQPSS